MIHDQVQPRETVRTTDVGGLRSSTNERVVASLTPGAHATAYQGSSLGAPHVSAGFGAASLRIVAAFVIVFLSAGGSLVAQTEDFGTYRPFFQGKGSNTRGGRGGTVHTVTNLNDNGDGSLRAALTASGPRYVLFEVSGTIALRTPIVISNPFMTVAGQTAPSPGITVRNQSVIIDTNDIVLQHLRLRLGDSACPSDDCAAGGDDVLYIRNNAFNIVIDHLSVSWGTHGGIDINAWSGDQPSNIAILDSIVSENLTKKTTPYGTGTILMPSSDGTATFARNLHAHNGNSNPWVTAGWRFAGYNNLDYNASSIPGDRGTLAFFQLMGGYGYGGGYEAVWVSNLAIPGPNTDKDAKGIKIDMHAGEANLGNTVHLADNVGPNQLAGDPWSGVTFMNEASEAAVRIDAPPLWYMDERFVVMPSDRVEAYVLANAGARPLDRDAVDRRIVQEVVSRSGRLRATPDEAGGYPRLAENRRVLTMPSEPHRLWDGSGRTRLEAWLEATAQALEPARSGVAISTPMPAPTGLLPQ